jgi:hypothetical protein
MEVEMREIEASDFFQLLIVGSREIFSRRAIANIFLSTITVAFISFALLK